MNNPRRSVQDISKDLAIDAVMHLKQMYPLTYNTKPKTAMVSLRGYIHNSVKSVLTAERAYYEGEIARLRALCGEMVEILDKINIGGIRRVRYQTIEQVLAKAKKEMGE